MCNFQTCFRCEYLKHFICLHLQVNTTQHHWWKVNIGLSTGVVPPLLPVPMLPRSMAPHVTRNHNEFEIGSGYSWTNLELWYHFQIMLTVNILNKKRGFFSSTEVSLFANLIEIYYYWNSYWNLPLIVSCMLIWVGVFTRNLSNWIPILYSSVFSDRSWYVILVEKYEDQKQKCYDLSCGKICDKILWNKMIHHC